MNIILIGMMGSGKSTVGKELAKMLDLSFVDTDDLLENKYGKISDIFKTHGEFVFRIFENSIIESLEGTENTVIATGGGVVLLKENMTALKKYGKIIYLKTELSTIYERTHNSDRPLVKQGGFEKIKNILNQREILYSLYSDKTISTENKTPEIICDEIKCILKI